MLFGVVSVSRTVSKRLSEMFENLLCLLSTYLVNIQQHYLLHLFFSRISQAKLRAIIRKPHKSNKWLINPGQYAIKFHICQSFVAFRRICMLYAMSPDSCRFREAMRKRLRSIPSAVFLVHNFNAINYTLHVILECSKADSVCYWFWLAWSSQLKWLIVIVFR